MTHTEGEFAKLEAMIAKLHEKFDEKIGKLDEKMEKLANDFEDTREFSRLQADSARLNAQMRGNLAGGFDFNSKPPGDAFVEKRNDWVPRSDYETD